MPPRVDGETAPAARGRARIMNNGHKSRSGPARMLRALRYSMAGLRAAWIHEHAFRQEIALAAVLVPIALIVPGSLTQRSILVGCVFVVLAAELLNSAIESAVDRVSLDDHELAKRAKDVGSAAVFIALVNLAVVWAMVLIDVFT